MRDALPFASQYSRSGVVVVEGVCVGDVYVTVEVELATLVVVWVVLLVIVLKEILGVGDGARDTVTVVSLTLDDGGVGDVALPLVVAVAVKVGLDAVGSAEVIRAVVVRIGVMESLELTLPHLGGTFKKTRCAEW